MKKMWGLLVHFGEWSQARNFDHLRFDRELWERILEECVKYEIDTIFLDIGAGIRFKSYPELAIKGCWEAEEMAAEVQRVKKMGIRLLPKLNFSAAHDPWAGEFGRSKISTPEYYTMCKALINEMYEIFDSPEYIHLGLDEESPDFVDTGRYFRKKEVALKDYKYLCDCVKELGATPCMWNCPFLYYKEDAYDYFDTDVLITSYHYYTYKKEEWTKLSEQPQIVQDYYNGEFKQKWIYQMYLEKYGDVPMEYVEQDPVVEMSITLREELVKHGYKLAMASTNFFIDKNDRATVEYYHGSEMESSIVGYLACPWKATIPEFGDKILEEIRLLGEAKKEFYV